MKIDNQQKVILGIVGLLLLGVMSIASIQENQRIRNLYRKLDFNQNYEEQAFYQRKDLSKKLITKAQREQDELVKYLTENWDQVTIDGSTSMKPLHQALNDRFGDKRKTIDHSKTVDAFEKFIKGEKDILLGVAYSDELLNQAEESGVKLVSKEITREAFVFLVKEDNPVEELTIDQLKKIYNGEITNWKEVGGNDENIVAYQRNENSGSQIRMNKFMGKTLLSEPIYVASGMGSLIWYVVEFEYYGSGGNAIGYNMYTFVDKQYGSEGIKFIHVDGVAPTDETIFDETYPIVIYNYIYHDENNKFATEFANKLYQYLMSEEGQQLISDAGYINVKDQIDRNTSVRFIDDKDEDYYSGRRYYDEETGKYYKPNEKGHLQEHDSYVDYILAGTKYEKNKNARKFIDMIDRTGLAGERVGINNEEGYLAIEDVWSENDGYVSAYELNILYKEEYYYALIYYVDRDQYAIDGRCYLSYDSETQTVEYGDCSDRAEYSTEMGIPNLSGKLVELTWEELKELKVKPPSNNGSAVSEENYYQPFKNE